MEPMQPSHKFDVLCLRIVGKGRFLCGLPRYHKDSDIPSAHKKGKQ